MVPCSREDLINGMGRDPPSSPLRDKFVIFRQAVSIPRIARCKALRSAPNTARRPGTLRGLADSKSQPPRMGHNPADFEGHLPFPFLIQGSGSFQETKKTGKQPVFEKNGGGKGWGITP